MTRLFRASIELTEDLPDGVHTVATASRRT